MKKTFNQMSNTEKDQVKFNMKIARRYLKEYEWLLTEEEKALIAKEDENDKNYDIDELRREKLIFSSKDKKMVDQINEIGTVDALTGELSVWEIICGNSDDTWIRSELMKTAWSLNWIDYLFSYGILSEPENYTVLSKYFYEYGELFKSMGKYMEEQNPEDYSNTGGDWNNKFWKLVDEINNY